MNLKDLAASLGLSQTTVSRALNGYPEVSEATRKRVSAAALAHGYRPDSRARSLATGKAMAVGLVLPMTAKQEIVNPVFADFVAGAAETLAMRGYDIVLSLASEEEQTNVYRSMLSKGRVDGMIMQAPLTGDPRIALLKDLGMPFVVHGRVSDHDDEYCWMDMDNRHAFHEATDHLLDLGHVRVALLNGIEAMDFAHRRRDGFLDALSERGLNADPEIMASSTMTEQYGYNETMRMLALPEPPSAILTSSLLVAMGAHRAIEARGLRMGLDVSVVTHDDGLSYLPNGTEDAPIFTATQSPVRSHGNICAEMLLKRIDQDKTPPIQTKLKASLVVGPSSGPAPTL
ncbi:LacI family DNA-binding transcriptional regulator [Aliiruegeria sabulilitoris]|uniref:LacI family DNA-binding transcriptional regulator n=1 Tax=Aliiruegeria sabulilitoris TaxID=1510458 RepID=UPI00082C0E33|nr:substrate-binding domain-containing protein [Aliiruegeria sabulilitoris]NDR58108.1 LacI family DNA-binding transcriptional regulator [Pseudoruegeria sp. M32A2M]